MNIVKLLTWMRGHFEASDIEKKQVELALISALKMSPEIDLSGAQLNSEDIKNLFNRRTI